MKASVGVLVLLTLYLGSNEASQCIPNSTFKVDCNTCTCGPSGFSYSCETKKCTPLSYEDKYEITKTADGRIILKPKHHQPFLTKLGLVTSDRIGKQKREQKETDKRIEAYNGESSYGKEIDKDGRTFNSDKKMFFDDWMRRFDESNKEESQNKKIVYQTGIYSKFEDKYSPFDDDDSNDQSDDLEQSGDGIEDIGSNSL